MSCLIRIYTVCKLNFDAFSVYFVTVFATYNETTFYLILQYSTQVIGWKINTYNDSINNLSYVKLKGYLTHSEAQL